MNLTLPRFFWSEYRKRRKRNSLITFALFWGTLSILLLMAFGQGMSTQFHVAFTGLGETLIMVYGGQTSLPYEGLPKGRQISLFPEDVDYLKDRIPEILRIAPESYGYLPVSAEGKEINRTVHGTTAEFGLMRTQVPQLGGRFINPDDVAAGRKVAFIGWKVATDLFGGADAVGRTIVVSRVPFTVVGVLQKKIQDSMYQGPDADQIYLPFHAFRQLDNRRRINQIHIQPREASQSLLIESRVKTLLGRKYRFDPADRYATSFWNTIEDAKEGQAIFKGIEIFLGIIGALTLLIGAVGVTNLMYAAAKERTKEIGIKLAIGARRRTIVGQFFLETVFVFAKGTFWGFIAAFNIVHLIRLAPINYESFGIEAYLLRPEFSLRIFVAYVAVLSVLCFLSGIFPALRASRANPIESLRYE
ncbi:MAG: ABC transporter permease [Candidatus Aminicenantes bacterium]|nr:ABC transporter permease [Candidatus Aminicenantes bacterium]